LAICGLQNTLLQTGFYVVQVLDLAKWITNETTLNHSFYSINVLLVEVVFVWPVQIVGAILISLASNYMERVPPLMILILLAPTTFLVACLMMFPFQSAFLIAYFGTPLQATTTLLASTVSGLLWIRFYRMSFNR